ncbi:hypothetical protein PAMP_002899 [Pampus punctatissimus]
MSCIIATAGGPHVLEQSEYTSHKDRPMDILPLLCIVSLTGLTKGDGVLPDGPLTAAVGGTVMFTTTVTPPDKRFLVVAWSFSFNNTQPIPIITSTSSDIINPEYEGRITLNRSTGSLELRDLALTDSREYRVNIVPDGGQQMLGSTRLEILGGEGQENTAHPEEMNYVGVHFSQNKSGGTVQLGQQNNTTEYAEIKVNNGLAAVSTPPAYDVHMPQMKRPAPQPGTNGAQVYPHKK